MPLTARLQLSDRTVNWSAAALLAVSWCAALYLASTLPLAADETYYWEWSRRPALGYYDQGPLIAWWIWGSARLFGETALGLRLGALIATGISQLCLFTLARRLFGATAALFSLALLVITPLALGGFILTYDTMLGMAWAAAMLALHRAFELGKWRDWIAVGLFSGLGLLGKHTMVFLLPCALVYAWGVPAARVWLRRPHPYVAILLAAAVFAPNLWWQHTHHWITFTHLFFLSGKGLDHGPLRRLGDFAGSQVLMVTPLLFGAFVWALVRAWRERKLDPSPQRWYAFSMSAPLLVFFLVMVAKSKVQANWAICGWMTCAMVAADYFVAGGYQSRAARRFMLAAAGLAVILCVLASAPGLRYAMGVRSGPRMDQLNKLYGGAELAARCDAVREAMAAETGRPVAAGSSTYDIAGRMAFYMAGRPRTRCFFLSTRMNAYSEWNDESGLVAGGSALVVDDRPPDDPKMAAYSQVFDRVVPEPGPVEIRRPYYRVPVHTYYLYRCYGYRPGQPAETPRGG